jgi:hypothetical protein
MPYDGVLPSSLLRSRHGIFAYRGTYNTTGAFLSGSRQRYIVCGQLLYLFLLIAFARGSFGNLRAHTPFLHECLVSEKKQLRLDKYLAGSPLRFGLRVTLPGREYFCILRVTLPGWEYFCLLRVTLPGREYFCLLRVTLPGREYFCLRRVTLPGREYFCLLRVTLPGREYFCLLRITLPGQEFFCLRRVFPASRAEDSRKTLHSEVFPASRVYWGKYRIFGW